MLNTEGPEDQTVGVESVPKGEDDTALTATAQAWPFTLFSVLPGATAPSLGKPTPGQTLGKGGGSHRLKSPAVCSRLCFFPLGILKQGWKPMVWCLLGQRVFPGVAGAQPLRRGPHFLASVMSSSWKDGILVSIFISAIIKL